MSIGIFSLFLQVCFANKLLYTTFLDSTYICLPYLFFSFWLTELSVTDCLLGSSTSHTDNFIPFHGWIISIVYIWKVKSVTCSVTSNFYNPMDCRPWGSSIHGILLARIWDWIPFLSPVDLPNPGIEPWSTALQVDSLPYEPSGRPCVYISQLICGGRCRWTFSCIHAVAIVNCAAVNTAIHMSLWMMFSSGYMPRNGTAWLHGSFIPSFLRNLYTVPHSSYINLFTFPPRAYEGSLCHMLSIICCL